MGSLSSTIDDETAELGPPSSGPARGAVATPAGAVLGRYLVIEEIGRGGMGVVLRAYDPKLQREVALKILRHAAMAGEAQPRMIREARAMAKLNHPNVVAIYDVELEGDGVMLAMEYVPGTTLQLWLEEAARTPKQILAVLTEAGRGLAAAHAEGLLHRDFKPANVLIGESPVAVGDATHVRWGRVRVTDFGIARAEGAVDSLSESNNEIELAPHDSFSTSLTKAGTVLGTPRYMAPEQRAGTELTSAADQYSFCIALWEALAGEHPFSEPTVRRRKSEPPPPWPTKDVALPRSVGEALRRGLAVDPADRWPSMSELLEALAVDRGAPRRGGVVAMSAVGTLAIVWALWSWSGRGEERCSGAAAQLEDVWSPARQHAITAAFQGSGAANSDDVGARTIPRIDAYAASWIGMHTDACEATTIRGEQSIAVMDSRMACLQRAKSRLRAAVDVLEDGDAELVQHAHDVVDGLPALSRCADIEALQADGPLPDASEIEAVEHIRELLARASALQDGARFDAALQSATEAEAALTGIAYEPVHAEVLLRLGKLRADLSEYEASESLLREALRLGTRSGQWSIVLEATGTLVFVVGDRGGRPAEALAFADFARGLSEHVGDVALQAMLSEQVAGVLVDLGQYREAEAEYRRALQLREQAGAETREIGSSHASLAMALYHRGEFVEAESEARLGIDVLVQELGSDHPQVATARNGLAAALMGQGKFEDAEAEFRRVLEVRQKLYRPDHQDVVTSRNNLATIYIEQKRYAEAESEMREVIRMSERSLGSTHPDVAKARSNLAGLLARTGQTAEAEAEFRAALRMREEQFADDHPAVIQSRGNLGKFLVDAGRSVEALPLLEHGWALKKKDGTALDQGLFALALARALWDSGRDRPRALELGEQAEQAFSRAGPQHADQVAVAREWRRTHR